MDLGLRGVVAWFLVQVGLLYVIGRISVKSNRDPRFQNQAIMFENTYQQPAVEENSNRQLTEKSVGIVVECEGIPFSLVNSGPLKFEIVESVPLTKKKAVENQAKVVKNQTYQIEQVDIRCFFMAKTSPLPSSIVNERPLHQTPTKGRRFEDQPNITEITSNKSRRLEDIQLLESPPMKYKGEDHVAINFNKIGEYTDNIDTTSSTGILTRSK